MPARGVPSATAPDRGAPVAQSAELQVCTCEAGGPNAPPRYGMMGRVAGEIQNGVCTVADEAPVVLPQRRSGAGLLADPPRTPPDLDVLRQVLAGLRRLDWNSPVPGLGVPADQQPAAGAQKHDGPQAEDAEALPAG
jgi:hypothetical protein